MLSAADAIDRPFAVLNADDYYGAQSFKQAPPTFWPVSSRDGRPTWPLRIGNTVPTIGIGDPGSL